MLLNTRHTPTMGHMAYDEEPAKGKGQRYGVYPEHEMPSRVSPCLQETQLLGWGWVLEFRYHCLFDMVALVRLCLGAPQASMARDCMWNNDSIIFHRDHRYNFSHF